VIWTSLRQTPRYHIELTHSSCDCNLWPICNVNRRDCWFRQGLGSAKVKW
jgi:hypothetical protein